MTTETRAVVRGWMAKRADGELRPDIGSLHKAGVRMLLSEADLQQGWTIVRVEIHEIGPESEFGSAAK